MAVSESGRLVSESLRIVSQPLRRQNEPSITQRDTDVWLEVGVTFDVEQGLRTVKRPIARALSLLFFGGASLKLNELNIGSDIFNPFRSDFFFWYRLHEYNEARTKWI